MKRRATAAIASMASSFASILSWCSDHFFCSQASVRVYVPSIPVTLLDDMLWSDSSAAMVEDGFVLDNSLSSVQYS